MTKTQGFNQVIPPVTYLKYRASGPDVIDQIKVNPTDGNNNSTSGSITDSTKIGFLLKYQLHVQATVTDDTAELNAQALLAGHRSLDGKENATIKVLDYPEQGGADFRFQAPNVEAGTDPPIITSFADTAILFVPNGNPDDDNISYTLSMDYSPAAADVFATMTVAILADLARFDTD